MNTIKKITQYVYPIAMVFIIWYILHLLLDAFIVPNPIKVFLNFIEIGPTILTKHLLVSGYRLLIALGITMGIGYSIGLALGISKRIDHYVSPVIYLLFPVPRIAFLPVFMVIFGLKDTSKIILIIAIAIFQVIVSIRDAVKEVPEDVVLSARSLKLSSKQIMQQIYIPATMPRFFTSLRLAVGSGIGALFFAENYATTYGIGYFIMNSWIKVDYEGMYSGIIAISLLGILLFKGIDFMQYKICKWL